MEEQKQEPTPEERIAALEKIIVQQGLPIAQGDRRFKEVKSLIDDVLGRITWRGVFMLLISIEVFTDGPNGSVERMLESVLQAFAGGG